MACYVTAAGMTVYWLYKYLKDEDLVQMDFKPMDMFPEGQYPMISICFWNPVVESKLKQKNYSLTVQRYLEALKGDRFYPGIEDIDFDDVTLNLKDFYLGSHVKFRNGTQVRGSKPNTLNNFPEVTYAGVQGNKGYAGELVKCFGLQFEYTGIDFVGFGFNQSIFANKTRNNFMNTFIHLPNKIVMSVISEKGDWKERPEKKEYIMNFIVKQLKVLRRRNKKFHPCIPDDQNYDLIILNDHLQKAGCAPPYQKTKSYKNICKSKEEMKKANFDFMSNLNLIEACTVATTILYDYQEIDYKLNNPDWFNIYIQFPSQYEEIVMVQAVDIHSALGNSGGYIGLFLGKTI